MNVGEHYEPTPGTDLARFVRRARGRGIEAHAIRPKVDARQRRPIAVGLDAGFVIDGENHDVAEGRGMDDERGKTNEERIMDEVRAGARERGADIHVGRIPDEELPRDGNEELRERGFETIPGDELPEGTVRVTFFGEARRVPEVGERVEVRIEDGSWRLGFRATSEPTTDEEYPGERVVWISAEDEWLAARREGRQPAGAPWPLEQMAAAGE